MTINVYESIMPGDPSEVYDDHGMTIEQFVKGMTDDYRRGDCQPISCTINGAIVKPMDWCDVVIRDRDNVEFRPVPKGAEIAAFVISNWVYFAIGAAVVGGTLYAISRIPSVSQGGQGSRGSQIDPANSSANVPRLGQAVPEGMGKYIRYPDYLNQPRAFYQNRRTQVVRLMLCVGVGSYQIDPDTVKIGETPINELSNAEFTIYQPGDDLSAVPNHENWFQSPEVGSTQGSAGIRLRGPTYDERTYFGSAIANNDTLTSILVGDLWSIGAEGSIKMTQPVTITDGGSDIEGDPLPDVITGNFQHLLAGMTVNVESNLFLNGTYTVASINAGKTEITLAEITDAIIDSGSMSIDKAGTKYKLLSTFGGFQIDVERILSNGSADQEWSGQLPQSSQLTVEIIWEADTFTAARVGPFFACPDGETTDSIEIDVFAPQGLGTIDGQSVLTRNRTIRIEWREVGTTTWNEQLEPITAETRDQLGWTFSVALGSSIRPEVRVSRVGSEDVSVAALDRLDFTALRAKLPTVTSYPDITTMAVDIVGADEISSGSNNQINLEFIRKLPEISAGAFTAETATRKISAAACYVAKSLGYKDDQLDLEEFERLENIWTPRGDYFDYVFSDGTAKDAIDTILRAGFAEFTLQEGVITPVRDEPRTIFEQGYSPENMTAPLRRQFSGKQVDEPDGVEVEYTKADTWTTETVKCFLPGDVGAKLDKIKIDGVTDETRAWRIGMRRRRAQRYRRWTYTFDTELDALNSQYLSYVPLLDDIPGYGKVAILEDIQADRITVSEPVIFEAGKTHVVAYRDENGDTVGPFTATEGPDEFTLLVSIPEPWPEILPSDREPTHIYFGTTERWHFPALITEINPSDPLSVGVTATNYDDRVYLSDDSAP